MEGGWATGSFTLPLSISLKATSHLHLGHKASVTLGWTTIVEKVELGTSGHEGRTLSPSMLFRTFSLLLLIPLSLDRPSFLCLFSTYVFSLHCINLHFVCMLLCKYFKGFFSSHICVVFQLKCKLFEGRNHVFGFFCISHSTFYCESGHTVYVVEWHPEWSLPGWA